ncbi:putative ATP-dependent RNA helicase DDX20 [Chanos chanos]|uniref:RNA helicase n=1 Tax=Chanos chanos TaxID=29144 RepID=A0A6J2WBP6_CHACN|nr:probable ATP-dependent RNA helicase DDX20 [Chanos chanos]
MAASMRKAAHEITTRKRTDDVLVSEDVEFSSLLLSNPVLDGLSAAGFQRPSPIQLKAIPLGRCGLDLIVQAKSGTGKTCVFATIALESLVSENTATQVLVLAPTREIAVQIHSVIMAIGCAIEGLQCHVFIGGTPVNQDKINLKKCHIAVGSPGRIKQLIEMGLLVTSSIRLFVLDEADKLLEQGSYQDQVNWIFSSLPENKQMLALSATYPEYLAQHLTRYMREPTFVRLNPTDPGLIGLKQYYKLVHSNPLPHKVFEEKALHLLELFSKVPFNQALVFSNLHSRAQHLADILSSKGLPSVCISGSLSQDQRLEAMSKLKQYQCRVLISTDLTSRGIDAEKVNMVVNLDVPQDWETYMHRIGRAGRFGTLGIAVTYCCYGEEENKMRAIAQKCSLNLTELPDPIPSGLMEEASDWNVTIEPPSKTQLALLEVPRLDKKKKAKSEPKVLKSSTDTPPSDPIGTSKNQEPSGAAGKTKKPTPVSDTLVSSPRMRVTVSPEPNRSLTRKEMQDALPKIPPLPSFKPRGGKLVSFEKAVADFESFITDGPGRSVEIIRQYQSHGEDSGTCNGQHKKGEEKEHRVIQYGHTESHILLDGDHPPLQGVSKMSSRPSPTSGFTSDSSSSSSDSESDMQVESRIETPTSNSLSGPPKQTVFKTDPENIAGTAARHGKSRQSPIKPASQTPHRWKASQTCQSTLKSEEKGSVKKPRADRSSRGRQRKTTDDSDDMPGEEEEEVQDYWRAYYRAWQNYYGSVSPAYQHYHSAHSWMAAYRMNTVYMMELMKH